MNLHDWIDELSDVLELEDVEVDEALLADLAGAAADNVERLAAPVTAYLLGVAAATSGAGPDEVEALAARAQALAEGWDRPAGAGGDPAEDGLDDDADDGGVDHSGETYDDDRMDELVDDLVEGTV